MAADINENTKVAIRAGSIFGAIVVLLIAGRYWGAWEATRDNQTTTLARHEAQILDLQKAVNDIKEANIRTQGDIKASLDASNRADGKGTAILLEMSYLREALAARGISVRANNKGEE